MNQFLVIGKTAEQPKIKMTATGIKYTQLVVDAKRPYKNKESKYDYDRFCITLWNKLAEECCDKVYPGDAVLVKGRNQAYNFEKDCEVYYKTEMVGESFTLLSDIF